jgi:hypothetical protein
VLPSETTNRPTQTFAGRFASRRSNHNFFLLPNFGDYFKAGAGGKNEKKSFGREKSDRMDGGEEVNALLAECDG